MRICTILLTVALAVATLGGCGEDAPVDEVTAGTTEGVGVSAEESRVGVSGLDTDGAEEEVDNVALCATEIANWHDDVEDLLSWTSGMLSVADADTYELVSNDIGASTEDLRAQVTDPQLIAALTGGLDQLDILADVAASRPTNSELLSKQRGMLYVQVKVAERCYVLSLAAESDTDSP